MICGDGPSKAVLCGARPSATPPPHYESKQNTRLDIYFFASDVAQTPVAAGVMHRVAGALHQHG